MAANDETTIAEVYAAALLDLASAQQIEEAIDQEFNEFVAYLKIEIDFGSFVTSRVIDAENRRVSLDTMLQGKISALLLNTLQVLNRKGRLDLVSHVQRQYHHLYLQKQGVVEVDVVSAEPLSEEMRQRLQSMLEERTSQKVLIIDHIDPVVIGGLIVRIGDQQIDMSVRHQLRKFHNTLVEHAEQHIHEGTDLFDSVEVT